MQLTAILVSLSLVFFVPSATPQLARTDKYFTFRSVSGQKLCATSTATTIGNSKSALNCTKTCSLAGDSCQAVNYRPSDKQCHMFGFASEAFQTEDGCTHFLKEKPSCFNPPTVPFQRVIGANCIYPFTYNGELFHTCTTTIPSVLTPCDTYGCMLINRTAAACKAPDYQATYEYINITVQSVILPVPSIFGWIIVSSKKFPTPANYFNRSWAEYKNGFGDFAQSQYWLGLETLHQLTKNNDYRLRVEFLHSFPVLLWQSAEYWVFSIGDEASGYLLNVDGYYGDGGDAFNFYSADGKWILNGMKFSTTDVDNSLGFQGSKFNCAGLPHNNAGWWFNNCAWACLTCEGSGFQWASVYNGTVREARMMITRK